MFNRKYRMELAHTQKTLRGPAQCFYPKDCCCFSIRSLSRTSSFSMRALSFIRLGADREVIILLMDRTATSYLPVSMANVESRYSMVSSFIPANGAVSLDNARVKPVNACCRHSFSSVRHCSISFACSFAWRSSSSLLPRYSQPISRQIYALSISYTTLTTTVSNPRV